MQYAVSRERSHHSLPFLRARGDALPLKQTPLAVSREFSRRSPLRLCPLTFVVRFVTREFSRRAGKSTASIRVRLAVRLNERMFVT